MQHLFYSKTPATGTVPASQLWDKATKLSTDLYLVVGFLWSVEYTSSKKLTQVVFFWLLEHGKFPALRWFPPWLAALQLPVLLLLQWSCHMETVIARGLRNSWKGFDVGVDKQTMWSHKPPFLRKLVRAWTEQPEAVFSCHVFLLGVPIWVCREAFSIHYVGFGFFFFPVMDAEIRGVSAFQHFNDLEGFPEVI